MKIGERVRRERTARRMTLSALGEASGLSKGFISQVESGRSNPSIESLGRIAGSLGLSVADLLHDTLMPRQVQVAESGTALPEVFRATGRGERGVNMRALTETACASYASARLPAGRTLAGQDAPLGSRGRSLAVLVSGTDVRFIQGSMQTTLYAGDVVSWDPGRRYSFENRGESAATLFLVLEGRAEQPDKSVRLSEQGTRSAQPRADVLPEQGPLRLAAMRAHRDEQRGR